MMRIVCLNCARPYPDSGTPHRCPACGGLYDDLDPLQCVEADSRQPGIWRYLRLGYPESEQISLGEGRTPLVEAHLDGRRVAFKCEYANPTGSFKDRGSAALITFLASRGVGEAVEDSSGNAGASFAAYAARAGMRARVFVPEAASGPKRRQIEAYGAILQTITGSRSEATLAAERLAQSGIAYASHAHLPFNLAGYATAAYEIVEQLGTQPGAVIAPAGQGGLILGVWRGFEALRRAGRIQRMPILIAVQAAACAPLAAFAEIGPSGLSMVTEGATVAEGVRVRSPLRLQSVVDAVLASGGRFVAVDEGDILPGRDSLAGMGFYVEPTSALVWKALQEFLPQLPDPVVAVLTGSGYKWNPN
jgi:threonine synthase